MHPENLDYDEAKKIEYKARSSSGLGREVLILEIIGSNPIRVTKKVQREINKINLRNKVRVIQLLPAYEEWRQTYLKVKN